MLILYFGLVVAIKKIIYPYDKVSFTKKEILFGSDLLPIREPGKVSIGTAGNAIRRSVLHTVLTAQALVHGKYL
jgi:hypothetical protein